MINNGLHCRCQINFSLTGGFDGRSTYVYYELTEFYQNHRSYIQSRWDAQLRSITAEGNSAACSPLFKSGSLYYAPCGLIANSLFNDTFKLYKCADTTCSSRTQVSWTGSDISWKSDRDALFQNPPNNGTLCASKAFVSTFSLPVRLVGEGEMNCLWAFYLLITILILSAETNSLQAGLFRPANWG